MSQEGVKTYTCDNTALATTTPDDDWVHITIQSKSLSGYEHPVGHDFVTFADFKAYVANDLAPQP